MDIILTFTIQDCYIHKTFHILVQNVKLEVLFMNVIARVSVGTKRKHCKPRDRNSGKDLI